MDKFNEYVEERWMGMYDSYDSPILEGLKRKSDEEIVRKHRQEFINYLAYKYEKPEIRYEFKNAKTDEEKEALINKYSKDFSEWVKRQRGLQSAIKAFIGSIGFSAAGAAGIGMLFSALAWGMVIKTYAGDINAKDRAREEEYLNKKGKK